jgi:predicted ArsR family transcriptional regulator
MTEPGHDLEAVGALAEPHRRALYDYVVAQRTWVSREEAAAAVELGRGVTAHHLDRLEEDGLLESEYRRLNDRRGPGAGRPAKVYRRTSAEISVNLPPRAYELAARILAGAAERAQSAATPIGTAIDRVARDEGSSIGATVAPRLDARSSARTRRACFLDELGALGFEPERRDDGVVVLHNCPFHHLATSHTELVCNMNLSFLDGLVRAVDGTELHAALEPEDGYCCVRFHSTAR